MFFTEDLLTSKKGSFGLIWLAATLGPRAAFKRLTKKQLAGIDLTKTCELIAEPPEPLALRLSGCLLVGVARVYNSSYEAFYTDVNNFHSQLRRSIITDFATTTGADLGEIRGLDLPGGGKSKTDAITFEIPEFAFDGGWDLTFPFTNWNDPLKKPRARRSTSKLESINSQVSANGEEEDEEEDDELLDEDEEESESGRAAGRQRLMSSPRLGARPRNTLNYASEPIDAPPLNLDPVDMGIDWDGFGLGNPDSSFDVPAFEVPYGDQAYVEGGDMLPREVTPRKRRGSSSSLDSDGNPKPPKIASRARRRSSEDPEAEDAVVVAPKAKRTKRVRKMVLDDMNNLELPESSFYSTLASYTTAMKSQQRDGAVKEKEKKLAQRVEGMVDSGGGWLDFFDPEMNTFFSTISRVDTWKWEVDVSAARTGAPRVASVAPEKEQDEVPWNGGEIDAFPQPQDVEFGGCNPDADVSHNWDDQTWGLPSAKPSQPTGRDRQTSEAQSEVGRNVGSQAQSQLPWDNEASQDDGGFGFFDVGNSSFTPGSMKLSAMTPQEARLRKLGNSSSSVRRPQPRSRSGSFAGRQHSAEPMFPGEDSQELPPDELDLEPLPETWRTELPTAFKPEMLATLEKSCRNFFSFIESRMIKEGTDEIEFEQLVPIEKSKRIAAAAFYNCLTLATKKILHVEQPDPWDAITVKFAITSL